MEAYEPRSTLVTEEPRAGYRSFLPHPALRPWVSCYRSVRRPAGAPPVRTIPDGCVDVTFDLADGVRGFATGVRRAPHAFQSRSAVRLLGVRSNPALRCPCSTSR